MLLSVLAALFVVSAYAQVTTSSLGGRVLDGKGEPQPGTVVTATHTPSGTLYYAVANASGQYHITGMRMSAGKLQKERFIDENERPS